MVLEDFPADLQGELHIDLDIPPDRYISPPQPGREPPENLEGEILLDEVFVDPGSGEEFLFFYGTITNASAGRYAVVYPIIALYDRDAGGRLYVARVAVGVTDPESLGSGETGEFVVAFEKAGTFDWVEARLFIDAVRP